MSERRDPSTSLYVIPFKCNYDYIGQGVIDEVEVVLAPLYLSFMMLYSFFINMSWYIPEYRFNAELIKSTWLMNIEVFTGMAYFYTSQVEVFRIWDWEFVVCDPIMWRYWLFHLAAF